MQTVRVEHCERVQLIVPTARITIANCRECLFYLGVNQLPLITGDNYNLQVYVKDVVFFSLCIIEIARTCTLTMFLLLSLNLQNFV
jgi:hypothetical protein